MEFYCKAFNKGKYPHDKKEMSSWETALMQKKIVCIGTIYFLEETDAKLILLVL